MDLHLAEEENALKGPAVWVVCPCYHDLASFKRLRDELQAMGPRFVLVDDSAGTDAELAAWEAPGDVLVWPTPRNMGHQKAIVWGLRKLAALVDDHDRVVTMDADGEDRPEDVPRLLVALGESPVLSLAQRTKRQEGMVFKALYAAYKVLFFILTGTHLRSGNFAAFPGAFVKAALGHPSFDLCYSTTLLALGQPLTFTPCLRGRRYAGRSKLGLKGLVKHGLRMLLPFQAKILRRCAALFAGLGSLALLCGVALWNGYPLLFFDSAGYIWDAFEGIPPREKALGYAPLVGLFTGGKTLWSLVLTQAALVLLLFTRVRAALGLPPWGMALMPAIALTVALTPVSWVVAHVLPDVFGALMVMALFLLWSAPPGQTRAEKAVLAVVFGASCVTHNGHLLLAFALLPFLAASSWRKALTVAGLTALAMASLMGLNFHRTGDVYLFRGGGAFAMNRLAEDGIAQKLLREHCGEKRYLLCGHEEGLSTERGHFLFGASPLRQLAGEDWQLIDHQLYGMVVDSVRYYPGEHLRLALRHTWEQFNTFDLADFIFRFPPGHVVTRSVERWFPGEAGAFMGSLQETQKGSGETPSWGGVGLRRGQGPNSPFLAEVHFAAFWAALVVLALGWKRNPGRSWVAFLFMALILNAFLCGVLSHVESRYQAKLSCLVLATALLFGEKKVQQWRQRT